MLNASSTCHAWATRLRPLIFGDVYLRSSYDARSFLELFRSSWCGTLRKSVKSLHLSDDLPRTTKDDVPWFHTVFLSRAQMKNCHNVFISVQASVAKTPHYTLLPRLPRPLPRSITQCQYIYLSKCHLRSFDELLTYSSIFSAGGTLNCTRISWDLPEDGEQGERPSRLSSANRGSPQEIFLGRIDVRWWFVWLFLTTSKRLLRTSRDQNRRVRFINPTQLPHLENLARCVVQTCGHRCSSHTLEIAGMFVCLSSRVLADGAILRFR